MILRDRDANAGWSAEADGTLEERTPPPQSYFLQNWRADVVGLVTAFGAPIQQMRYEPYRVAFGLPKCDLDGDGDVDAADDTLFDALHAASNIRADWNFDGDFDAADVTAFVADHAADADLGRGAPSYDHASAGGAVRKLYAGYEHDPALAAETYHVRHHVLLAELGRWTRRDPLGYVDGANLYRYARSSPVLFMDPSGLLPPTNAPPDCPVARPRVIVGHSTNCGGGGGPQPPAHTPHPSPPSCPPGTYDPDNSDGVGMCIPIPAPIDAPMKGVPPTTWGEHICASACDTSPNAWGAVACYRGYTYICNCVHRRFGQFADRGYVRHAHACTAQCEWKHLLNLNCADAGGDWWGDGVGHVCSECIVNTCVASCMEQYDCALEPPANQGVCQYVKEDRRRVADTWCKRCVL